MAVVTLLTHLALVALLVMVSYIIVLLVQGFTRKTIRLPRRRFFVSLAGLLFLTGTFYYLVPKAQSVEINTTSHSFIRWETLTRPSSR